jgi:chemotaxis methyl-accepting protein methylase
MKTITRRQLKSLGCSDYLARKLTTGVMYTKVKQERSYISQGVVKRINYILNNSLRLQYRIALLLEDLLEKLKDSSTNDYRQIIESSEMAEVINQIDTFKTKYSSIFRKSEQAIEMISDAIEEHCKTMQEYIESLSPQAQEDFLQSVGGAL